jgi:hypothetical protein
MVLTTVYNTQNRWVSGLRPSSGIITRKHNVSETGSVSVFMRGEEDTYFVGSIRKNNLNHWTQILLEDRTE